jgi:hypothetical protein
MEAAFSSDTRSFDAALGAALAAEAWALIAADVRAASDWEAAAEALPPAVLKAEAVPRATPTNP